MKSGSSFLLLVWTNLVCLSAVASDDAQEPTPVRPIVHWLQETFPNPQEDLATCQSNSIRICDPDSILDEWTIDALAKRIDSFERDEILLSCYTNNNVDSTINTEETKDKDSLKLQVAVAIVQNMDLTPFSGSFNDQEDEAAQSFATYLHNKWGVGSDSPACGGGTGILIFLSILDRAIYISTGRAVGNVLTDKRLEKLIEGMKPLLRNEKYADALLQVMNDIADYMKKGEPSLSERIWNTNQDIFVFILFGCFTALFVWNMKREHRNQREYAQVESQLSQLDRGRAEALQGRYQCTSCPICLECFRSEVGETNGKDSENDNSNTATTATNDTHRVGSDGKPLKLLRCGHVFDETCWSEWVSSGSGNVRRCPICQQDIGGSEDEAVNLNNTVDNNALQQRNAENVEGRDNVGVFNRERNFRLARIVGRYPQYVRPQQLQRWTADNYTGSLARDSSFVQNNPSQSQGTSGHRHRSSGGSSFGGGSSSSGRGGRW